MTTTAAAEKILETVAETFRNCDPTANWTDDVDDALAAIGFPTVTPRDEDPWTIAQLATPLEGFGVLIVYREGRGDGADAFAIVP